MRERRLSLIGLLLLAVFVLSACVETQQKPQVKPVEEPVIDTVKVEKLPGANLAAASLTLLSFDGLPPAESMALAADLQKEAESRHIVLVEAGKAAYLARGYFSAFASGEDTHFVYVWDFADAAKHNTQRVSDSVVIKGVADEPWSLFTSDVSQALAAKSADDLEALLSRTPEARPVR